MNLKPFRITDDFFKITGSKLLAASMLSAFSLQAAYADTLSLTVGGGMWNETAEGTYFKTGEAPIDVKDDLFWDTESQGYIFATLEHPIPIIPNARLSYTSVDHSGSGNASFVYDGITYNGNIKNDFQASMLDLLLYYEVLDNVVSVDLGLNIRKLDVDYMLQEAVAGMTTDTASATVPMLYGLVGFSPLPDLIISGEMSYVSYDGSTISDLTAKIAYTTSFLVGFEAGYRSQTFELDDVDDTNTDLTFDGPFVGAYLKF